MNARRVNAAAGVILAAQKTRQTAAGIAMVLEAACLLQSPESAAEVQQLRTDIDAFRDQRNAVFATNEELLLRVERADLERLQVENENRRLIRRIAELEATLSRIGARAEQRHLMDSLDEQLSHLADERPADDRRAASVSTLRGLLARQSGGAE